MPVLVVIEPDGTERAFALGDTPVDIGTAEDNDLRLEDPRVSGHHLRLAPLDDGTWMVADRNSSNGTRVGKRILLRAILRHGDELRIGDTRVTYREKTRKREEKPEGAPLVGGTLDFTTVEREAATPPPAPPAPPAPEVPAAPARPTVAASERRPLVAAGSAETSEPEVRVRPVDGRGLGRALLFVLVGILLVVGVEFYLGSQVSVAREEADALRALRAVLRNKDLSFDEFVEDIEDIRRMHPDAPFVADLDNYMAAAIEQERRRVAIDTRLNRLLSGHNDMLESDRRAGLLDLKRKYPKNEDLARRVGIELAGLNRRHAGAEALAFESTIVATEALLAQHDPAGALRRLSAYRVAWPSVRSEVRKRLREIEDRAIAAAEQLSQEALAAAAAETDPVRRRRILGEAWIGLAGTPQSIHIEDALRFTRRPGSSTVTATDPGAGSVPGGVEPGATPEPALPTGILARAAEAESLAQGRRWAEASKALTALLAESRPGALRAEWQARVEEMDLLGRLIAALDAAAKGSRPPRPKLQAGRVTVTAADPASVTWERAGVATQTPWPDVDDRDLVPLLAPARPTAEQRLAVAILAASVSERERMIEVLVPLFESGDEVERASSLVARYLYGRSAPPEGGYVAHKGEILDRPGYERRLKAERLAELRTEAEALLAKVTTNSAFKKLDKLREMRTELDRRREYALLAIFNEKHYPYPYTRGSIQYRVVQNEVDRRVQAVREIWDDTTTVKITTKGSLGKDMAAWAEALASLQRLGGDVADLEGKMAPYAAYATGEKFTIREFFLNEAERRLQAYNRWVMQTLNPAATEVATDAERQQTRVTNDYRIMIGFSATVTPGPALYDAIDETTVQKILDEGQVKWLGALRAVRIDDRLVTSSRAHSIDMQRRGFFSHFAPPNPATGEPRTSPFDRMQKAGYRGAGASENIVSGAPNPMAAHVRWCHSSGHHRNILSPWTDQGVGRAGKIWTQNFGSGGGRRPVIETNPGDPATEPDEAPDTNPGRPGRPGR